VWVTRFLHSEFCRSDEPVSVQAQRFLEDAAVKYPLQKRQLVSAQQALSLYVGLEQGNLRTSAWPQLIDRLRHQMRVRHYAPRTESTYVDWVRRFLTWHEAKSPHMAVPNAGATRVSGTSCGRAERRGVHPESGNLMRLSSFSVKCWN
jgi:hypothetical protein